MNSALPLDGELVRQAVLASDQGIVIARMEAQACPLVFVNPAFERLTGYPAAEAVGRDGRFLQREDRDQPGLDELRAALAAARGCVVTLRNYRRDGSLFWNRLQMSPVLDASGRATHMMATLADATAGVETEQWLLQKQERLEKAKRALAELALRDGLTGLYNRRCLDEQLEREWNRARRRQTPLSLFMVDIDHFKRFNDLHGHAAGDQCLCAVAGVLRRLFARSSDLVARYGGEEFAVVASGLDRRQARARAQALCEAVRALALPGRAGPPLGPVSVSVGVATVLPDERTGAALLLRVADQSLYQAKAQGRDRAVQAATPRALARAA